LICTITESAPVDSVDIEDEEFEEELGKLEAELLEEEHRLVVRYKLRLRSWLLLRATS
jgi:hypothetical protein